MQKNTNQIIIAVISLLVLDILWIYNFMGGRYKIMVNKIQGSKMDVNLYSAIGAYTLMVILLINVVIKYNLTYVDTFIFGFCLYGVYDLTCAAIFKDWNFNLGIIDMLWGGFVYTSALYISKELIK